MGAEVGSGVDVGSEVGAGVDVGTGIDVGGGVGDGVGMVVGSRVGFDAGVWVSVAMGVCVNSGDGVSVGAWVTPGCATVVGSDVGAGTVVAVGPAGTVVADAGEVCSPPQAARTIRAVSQMRTSVGTVPVPGNLPAFVTWPPLCLSQFRVSMKELQLGEGQRPGNHRGLTLHAFCTVAGEHAITLQVRNSRQDFNGFHVGVGDRVETIA